MLKNHTTKEKQMNIRERLLAHANRVRETLRSKGGFTLIEIMIVVAIIALLMGVLVGPTAMRQYRRAKVDAAKMQIKNFRLPLMEYMTNHGNYPSTDEGLQALVDDRIIKEKDIKDPWGNPFQYRFPAENDQDELRDLELRRRRQGRRRRLQRGHKELGGG